MTPLERATTETRDGGGAETLRRAFGRTGTEGGPWVPTDLGCPDCRGVLYVTALGKRGWLSFRCRVGHAFAGDTLITAKELQLEKALWDAFETLDELIQLYDALEQRRRANPTASVEDLEPERRIAAARKHRRQLRRLIDTDGPAPVPLRNMDDEGAAT